MESLFSWIGQHVLLLWAIVLILALLAGDRLWYLARRRRLAATGRNDYLALQPHTAATLLALFGTLFVLLCWAVWTHTALVRFDAALAQALHEQLRPDVLGVVALVTGIGQPALLMVAAAAVALLLALGRDWRSFVPWCVALGGTAACGEAAKQFVKRARPFGGHAFVAETGYSFPSGHAMMSMAFFGMLAYLLLHRLPPRRHRATVAIAVALVASVGISRVVLQAHYLSDVLAGYALGAFWLVLGIALAERLRHDARAR
ncbi:phosphatase PAP2 family protein [Rhodanobacter sp. DHB23]|uniref:phosphatase PAP2 family protein n=1 Tax=Rhodanobacter sp. DHB23 TaxID=2775923 RepID=UPI00177B0927|nr:phosphatase PAP2 family protein [Rhodanobacter sp. DHB23]MBD8874041.1 phosphatase PAP2 family protein [Rhodanobacter sp. DHB23]